MDDDQLVVTGMACRFPGGANTIQAFWRMLTAGEDGVCDVPESRWNIQRYFDPNRAAPGRMYVNQAAFIDQDIAMFDAGFFGISPREAAAMDPQQRILLEVTWEALEDAGMDLQHPASRRTGVFVGGFMLDNHLNQLSSANQYNIGSYAQIGSTLSLLSNRISYALNLQGPSLSVDTACSSSLVALHQACLSLKNGDCDQAIVAGANIMFRPENPIGMCKAGMLAPDGRSKAFDARGDGYGRGEGVGVVVLRRLSNAVENGDAIYAHVRGTGVNQDGRSEGITVPSVAAQTALATEVLTKSNVRPEQIVYIEAHGTGTAVGDPIEISALGAAIGKMRDCASPCYVGSVKPNIGHLEAAAGIAGFIKSCLILRSGIIPKLANFQSLNPAIDLDVSGLSLPLETLPLPGSVGERCVALNSFGYGGTNGHAVLQEHKEGIGPDLFVKHDGAQTIVVTAADAHALSARAGDLARSLTSQSVLRDVAFTLAKRRTHLSHRLVLQCDDIEDAKAQLSQFHSRGETARGLTGTASARDGGLAFVCSGMGPQWWAMGRELYRSETVYKQTADSIDEVFKAIAGWSIVEELCKDEKVSRVTVTEIAQPANFLLQASVAALWNDWGVHPTAILGHSVGEISSAYLSGVLTLEDAACVAYHRSRIQARAAGTGGMAAIGMSENEALAEIARYEGELSIAAINSPKAITVSGGIEAIQALTGDLANRGRFARQLTVEVPYHSHLMDPLMDDLRAALDGIATAPAKIPVYSSVTGRKADSACFTPEYWVRNMRQEVRFMDAVIAMNEAGTATFLEIGPHPVLSGSITETLKISGKKCNVFHSLRRGRAEQPEMLNTYSSLIVVGAPVSLKDSTRFGGGKADIPHYPWQRTPLWSETSQSIALRTGGVDHRLLGDIESGPRPTWRNELTLGQIDWLRDHRIQGSIVFPGAAYVEMATAAALTQPEFSSNVALNDIRFIKPLLFVESRSTILRTEFDPVAGLITIFSKSGESDQWNVHFTATATPGGNRTTMGNSGMAYQGGTHIEAARFYEDLHSRGMDYGPFFQRIASGEIEAEGERGSIDVIGLSETDSGKWNLHPAVLDAVLHSVVALLPASENATFVPAGIESYSWVKKVSGNLRALIKRRDPRSAGLSFDVDLMEQSSGDLVAQLRSVSLHEFGQAEADHVHDQWLFEMVESARLETGTATNWLVLGDVSGEVACEIEALGLGGKISSYQWRSGEMPVLDGDEPLSIIDVRFDPSDLEGSARALNVIESVIDAIRLGAAPSVKQYVVLIRGVEHDGDAATMAGIEAISSVLRVALTEGAIRSTKIVVADEATSLRQSVGEAVEGELEGEIRFASGHRLVRRLNRTRHRSVQIVPASAVGVRRTESFTFTDFLGSDKSLVAQVSTDGIDVVFDHALIQRIPATVIDGWAVATLERPTARSVYTFVLASHLAPLLRIFDSAEAPDGDISVLALGIDSIGLGLISLAALARGLRLEITQSADAKEQHDLIVTAAPMSRLNLSDSLKPAGEIIYLGNDRHVLGGIAISMPQSSKVRWLGHAPASSLDDLTEATVLLCNPSDAVAQWIDNALRPYDRLGAQVHRSPTNGFISTAAYLVTGGTGLVGRAIATMIAKAGGGHIVLLSRSGRMSRNDADFLDEIRSFGVNVHMLAADVSLADAITSAIEWIEREVAPLRGIFHAAGLLDDAVISAITRQQLERNWNAKAGGAENLANAARHLALDHFVLISSISSLIGNPGQGSYCAANGFLDGLATQRRQSGLPAVSICLGPVSASGMAANVEHHLRSIGFEPYSPAELPDVIKSALTVPHAVVGLARFEPAKFLGTFPTWRRSSRNVAVLGLEGESAEKASFENVLYLDDDAAIEAISAILADVIAETVKTDRNTVLAASEFSALGMDSLLAIEAQLRIEDALRIRVSTLDLLGDCGVLSLATSTLTALRLDQNKS